MTETMMAPDWHVIQVPCTTCDSGVLVAVAPAWKNRARCAPCVQAGRPYSGDLVTVIPHEVPGAGKVIPMPRRPEPEDSGPYPAPEVTSRDPIPPGVTRPGPVASFVDLCERHGWTARAMYSRGRHPHATHGRPGAVSDWWGVQALHPETRARVVAVHCARSKSWDSVHMITRSEIASNGTITDAQEFVRLSGRVLRLRAWTRDRIAERARIAAARKVAKDGSDE